MFRIVSLESFHEVFYLFIFVKIEETKCLEKVVYLYVWLPQNIILFGRK
jgi:hypothetical protein